MATRPTETLGLTRRGLLAGTSAALLSGCVSSRRRRTLPQLQRPPNAALSHQLGIPWLPASVTRFRPLLEEASRRYLVDVDLLAVVVLVESGGQPQVSSPAGAIGLMQVMPATGADIAARRGIGGHSDARLLEPAYNIDFGSWYLSKQIQNFWSGDGQRTVELAAAAYNGGPGRLRRHLKGAGPLPEETRKYRRWVGGMWYERRLSNSAIFNEWMGAGGSRLVLASR